ncbi:kelch-like protein 23 [Carassius auratus]|uniref:Kelch-like protein n=2 Tax=Carassius TaxID=7956 RepID=A0A6P6PER0_CARAU|nr:kelch-like protein 23 [Carassius auratus]XP_052394720.1 kelch-like protein 23 [Carassius gibelio]UZC49397.1 kelch-like protein [Carassius auratus]UZC49398.1 kelch-like protein [Carassius auratus]UZH44913.1 kelch-like protein [Carassius gibelio]WEX30202.1 Kelch-like protein 23.2-A [Carassius auratus]WEX30300.1 Kelch-like protein 23.2-A [Carassius gibelio]
MACAKQDIVTYDQSSGAEKNVAEEDQDTINVAPDTVLQVEGEMFFVNREYLAQLSPYFRALFFGGGRESTKKHIEIKGVGLRQFQALMEFTKNLKLKLDCKNVLEILEAADFLQLDRARLLCCKFLERQLHLSNCLGMMAYAWQLGCLDLYAAARDVVLTHLPALASEQDFMFLPKESIADLLASDNLSIPKEDLALDVALRWATFDPSREEDFMELVGLVRPECLSLPYITDLLSKINSSDPRAKLICRLNDNLPSSWTMGRSMPRARSRETLFVLGGPHEQETQLLYQFHPYSGRWQSHPSLQKKCLTQYSVAALGENIVVTGGYFRDVLWYSVDWVSIYEHGDKRWVDGPAMKKSRHSHCSASLEFQVFVFGGSMDEGPVADVERLVLGAKEWDTVSPMVRAVERAATVTLGTSIYVACGLDENGDVYSGIQRYKPEVDQWDVVSYSPFPRYDLLATELNGALYLLGGQALRLDIDTDEWTVLHEDCLDNKFFTGCATVNGQIYILSERKINKTYPNMILLDPYTDTCLEINDKIPCPVPIRGCVTMHVSLF